MTAKSGPIPLGEVPPARRDRWRHELNHAGHHLAASREALGVLGAKEPTGYLRGLAVDLETIMQTLRVIQIEVAASIMVIQDQDQ